MKRWRIGVPISVGVLLAALLGPATAAAQVLTGSCLSASRSLAVEEVRLNYYLADNSNPSVLQSKSFAQQMIEGAGFDSFGPSFVNQLCAAQDLKTAQGLVTTLGQQLWRMAVDRAQQKTAANGSLPYSDDRPLYWTRLQVRAALRQWNPKSFTLANSDRSALIWTFDRYSRGMFDINFPTGKGVKRLIMSGFDPYTLDGGPAGAAPGAVGNNIRHGNPSGATALSLDGTDYQATDGTTVHIEAYTLPVNYPEFEGGYLEDTVGPFMQPGPQQVNASVTVSQAGPDQFNLEQWNGRYHGVSIGNDNYASCPPIPNQDPAVTMPQLAVDNNECNSQVVERWGGRSVFDFNINNPPQWTTTSLPIAQMIAANTGANVPRPPGDQWPEQNVAFGVVWHTNFTEFRHCNSIDMETKNPIPSNVPQPYPPATPPDPPDGGSCSYSGGGGNYLSNESAYRNTNLRDHFKLNIPAGHIHTPNMQHFDTTNLYNPSDTTFDAYRLAIIKQCQNLIHVVADNAPKSQ